MPYLQCIFPLNNFEADRRDHQFSQGQSMDQERGRERRHYDEMAGEDGRIVEGSDGTKVAREVRTGSDQQARGGM